MKHDDILNIGKLYTEVTAQSQSRNPEHEKILAYVRQLNAEGEAWQAEAGPSVVVEFLPDNIEFWRDRWGIETLKDFKRWVDEYLDLNPQDQFR